MASLASDFHPPEGARVTSPRSETVTVADRRRQESGALTEAEETTETAETAAAGITKIRVEVETNRRVTDTKTKRIEDTVGITTTQTNRLHEQLILLLFYLFIF